jgi:predicted GH43/DUF377 family glycosyl hydrolase
MQAKKSSQGQGRLPSFLEIFENNPILRPDSGNCWEIKTIFNAAAIYEGEKVHILYRAIWINENSLLRYASSLDGFHIRERLKKSQIWHDNVNIRLETI